MATATAPSPNGTVFQGGEEVRALTTRSGRDRRTGSDLQAGTETGLSTGFNGGAVTLSDTSGLFGPIRQVLSQPAVKKSLPLMVIALMLLVFALAYTMVNAPKYRPVVTGVTEGDQQAVFEALRAGEFKPVVDSGTGQITVPVNR